MERNRRYQQKWVTLVPPSLLKGNSRNYFESVCTNLPVRLVKLNNFPDGGIARLQLFGERKRNEDLATASPEWSSLMVQEWINKISPRPGFPSTFQPPHNSALDIAPPAPVTDQQLRTALPSELQFEQKEGLLDLVSANAIGGGGRVVASSSAHYSVPSNMLKHPRALNMGDGWETARLRGSPDYSIFHLDGPLLSDFNWTVIKLSQEGLIKKVVLDTLHFVNNHPIAFSLEGCRRTNLNGENYYHRSAGHVPFHSKKKKPHFVLFCC